MTRYDARRCTCAFLLHGLRWRTHTAMATIDVMEREDVCGYIGRIGKRLQDGLRAAGYDVRGHPTSPTVVFPSEAERMAFMARLCDKGVLAPYFAPSFSHTEADVDRTIQAAIEAGVGSSVT